MSPLSLPHGIEVKQVITLGGYHVYFLAELVGIITLVDVSIDVATVVLVVVSTVIILSVHLYAIYRGACAVRSHKN